MALFHAAIAAEPFGRVMSSTLRKYRYADLPYKWAHLMDFSPQFSRPHELRIVLRAEKDALPRCSMSIP